MKKRILIHVKGNLTTGMYVWINYPSCMLAKERDEAISKLYPQGWEPVEASKSITLTYGS